MPKESLMQLVPEAIVAAAPDEPHVAALDLVGAELGAVVHGGEIVLVRGRERADVALGEHRLILDLSGLRPARPKHDKSHDPDEQQDRKHPESSAA